jgi:superfamily II DNA or RNA helicase
MNLRDYQLDLFLRIQTAFRSGVKNPLIVSPTGSGKTVLFCHIADTIQRGGKRAIILVHRKELVAQTSKTLRQFDIPHGIIQSGITPDPTKLIQVAMVQTISRRLHTVAPPNLIICDEAHHMAAGDYRKIVVAFPTAYVIGVTATPQRLDGKGLADFFSDIIMGPTVEWLMSEGHLSRPKYFAPPMVADMRGVKKRMGDFSQSEAAAVMDKATITGDAVKHYQKICPDSPAIAFCVTVAHAQHVAEQFNAAGIKADTIHAAMHHDARKKIVSDLADGTINVMTSCDIVSEGFDVPVVGAAILLRPTTSLGLHLQQIGRVLRPCAGKTHSTILDHVGNLSRHGLAEDEREWSLLGQDKKSSKSEPLGLKQCRQCFCMHRPVPVCPECGYIYPQPRLRKLSVIEGNLEEFCRMPLQMALKECRSRNDLKVIQKAKGYKPGWTYYMAKELNLS